MRVGGASSEVHPLEDGVPMGSILSVTLFAVAKKSVIGILPEGVQDMQPRDFVSRLRRLRSCIFAASEVSPLTQTYICMIEESLVWRNLVL